LRSFLLLEHFLTFFSRWWFLEKQPWKIPWKFLGVLWIFLSFHLKSFERIIIMEDVRKKLIRLSRKFFKQNYNPI
jgi:hypothetical protein